MLPEPRDEHEEKAISDIRSFGLHIVNVLEDGELPNFSYSVGLWHTYKHPEVIIFGLEQSVSMWILNEIGRRAKEEGAEFKSGKYYGGFLEGFECTFLDVPQSHFGQHVGWDIWLYDGIGFPLVQCVWPNTKGAFPWEESAEDWFRRWQPVLNHTASN